MFDLLKELAARLRYLIDRAFAREFAGQLMLFAVLVTIVVLFGSTAIFFGLYSEENAGVSGIPRDVDQGVFDAFWWSLTYVMRLPAFEEMYGATGPILAYAISLSIMGLAVFGVLVSVINNAMRSRIELLRQGDTPVRERNHILVLGWNNKLFAVLRQLARLDPGARVVILAEREMREMSEALRVAGILRERLTIVLRSGLPSNREELERVAIRHAAGVIVLSRRSDDSEAIKTLVLLASRRDWANGAPSLTAEIAMGHNYELAELGARNRLHLVASSRVTSKIIVQTIRNPGLARVYDELMATDGNSIHVRDLRDAVGKTIEELAYGFADAIPIGISWPEHDGDHLLHKAALNPEADYDLADEESLVLIARSAGVSFPGAVDNFESSVYRERDIKPRAATNILLIGWTESVQDILTELDAHSTTGTRVTVLSSLPREEIEERLTAELQTQLTKLTIDLIEGNPRERRAYEELDLTAYDSIVVLADESDDDADTRTLSTVLRLSEIADERTMGSVVVELEDAANRDLFDGLGVTDIVVASDVVSAQLAQVCRQTVLGAIYRELLSAGGVEISLRDASEYLTEGARYSFADLIYATQQHLEIALGLYRSNGEVLLNPPRDRIWQVEDGDRIIVLAEQVYQ